MIEEAWSVLRRDPILLVFLLLALGVPAYLGALPLDQALAPLLDSTPIARGLDAVPLDDTLVKNLVHRVPSLQGTLMGGIATALLLASLGMWLVEAAIAAAAVGSRAPLRFIYGRGLGISLLALPLRAGPSALAAAIACTAHPFTWAPLRDTILFTAALYLVTSSMVTVIIDLARGHAIVDDGSLGRAFLDGLRAAWRDFRAYARLVALEIVSFGVALAVLALTRPLGLFHGVLWVAGLVALGARALGTALVVAASAARARL